MRRRGRAYSCWRRLLVLMRRRYAVRRTASKLYLVRKHGGGIAILGAT